MVKNLVFIFFALSIYVNHAWANYSCYNLLLNRMSDNPEIPAALVPTSVVTTEDRTSWIRENLLSLLKNSNLKKSSHAGEFLDMIARLKRLGLDEGSLKVLAHDDSTYIATIDFTAKNPKNKNQTYLIRAQMVLSINMFPFLKDLSIMNISTKVYGVIDKDADTNHLDAQYNQAMKGMWSGSGIWDSRQKSTYVDHLRYVLHDLIVPFALIRTDISEVGIGFPSDAVAFGDGRFSQPPLIIVTKLDNGDLLQPRHAPRTPFAGTVPRVVIAGSEFSNINIPNRNNYLIVYEEVLDQNPDGRIFAVDRTTREIKELYFSHKARGYSFEKPAANDAPPARKAAFEKLNSRLVIRIQNFLSSGYNPRIQVQIRGANGVENKILAVRDIARLSLSEQIYQINELGS